MMKLSRLSFSTLIAAAGLPLFAQTNTFPSSGNVGIGTTAPSTPLQVVGTITAGSGGGSTSGVDYLYGYYGNGKIFTLGSQYSSAASFLGYAVKAQPGATGYLSSTGVTVGRSVFEANNGYLAFWTGASQLSTDGGSVGISEQMRITAGGNVGIGTTNPSYKLEVNGAVASYGSTNQYVLAQTTASSGTNAAIEIKGGASNADWLIGTNRGDLWGAGDALAFYKNAGSYGAKMVIQDSGNVGIGTSTPMGKLNINYTSTNPAAQTYNGAFIIDSNDAKTSLQMGIQNSGGSGAWIQSYNEPATSTGNFNLLLNPIGGNVGIGTTSPTQKLSVNGTIQAKEVIVQTGWSDYVFAKGYRLTPLPELEKQIETTGHLPGIPSAQEVAEHGVSMGEMQSKLLAKVEELTLYVIDLKKENAELRAEVRVLRATKP